MSKKPIEFLIENIDGVIKFTPDNIDIDKKIGLVRTYPIDEKTYLDISFNFHGRLFKRSMFDAYGGQNPVQSFDNFCYEIKNIKELEFINVPEKVKIKVQLFEASAINMNHKLLDENFVDYYVRPIINNKMKVFQATIVSGNSCYVHTVLVVAENEEKANELLCEQQKRKVQYTHKLKELNIDMTKEGVIE